MGATERLPEEDRKLEAAREAATGGLVEGVTKKTACWVCGGDLTFNSLRAAAGAVTVQLYCKRCGVPRRMALHL